MPATLEGCWNLYTMSSRLPTTDTANPAAQRRTQERHPRPLGGDTARHVGPAQISLSGQILNNRETAPAQLTIKRKPKWLRAKMPGGEGFEKLRSIIKTNRLHTVCEEASCPNIGECWARGTATIMIMGDVCTRSCGFCNVKTGRPMEADEDEPRRVAASISLMGLKHVVITSVDRDDLPDSGAGIWASTIRQVQEACPTTSVEALIGDLRGNAEDLKTVIRSQPDILAHNLETVRRMHPAVRPQAKFERSVEVIARIKEAGLVSKTSIMVGIGERDEEVFELIEELQEKACTDILTIGQYLQPTRNHLPLDRWVHPDMFAAYREAGLRAGFQVVESGPLVRSSYHAEEQAAQLSPQRKATDEKMSELLGTATQRRATHPTSS